jgi:hypothetical protein
MKELLNQYRAEIEKIKPINYEIVFDDNWENIEIEKIEWVVVGDNPGVKEKEHKEYFSKKGLTGYIVRKHFKCNFNINDREILFLNKAPIHTATTAQLNSIENLEVFVQPIYKLLFGLNELYPKINFLIMGKGKNSLNKVFYNESILKYFETENFYFTPHFSNNAYEKVELECAGNGEYGIDLLKLVSNKTKKALKNNFGSKLNKQLNK